MEDFSTAEMTAQSSHTVSVRDKAPATVRHRLHFQCLRQRSCVHDTYGTSRGCNFPRTYEINKHGVTTIFQINFKV